MYPSLSPFFFTHTATTEIYTLSLHDALPILYGRDIGNRAARDRHLHLYLAVARGRALPEIVSVWRWLGRIGRRWLRSEEHTSELQSLRHLVCRLLLEKKKKKQNGTVC